MVGCKKGACFDNPWFLYSRFLRKLVSDINSSVACCVGIDAGALHNARWDDEEFVVSIKHD